MSRVLVTGATTPVGQQLVGRLLDRGADHVLAVGLEPIEATRFRPGPRLTYVRADLTHARRVRELMFGPARSLEIRTLIHMALHRDATRSGRAVWKLNVELTRLLLQLAEEHPTLHRFVLKSHSEIYRVRPDAPAVIPEDHPLELSPEAPQWVRDRVEADLTTCSRMGMSQLQIAVLRVAECLAPNVGSQLHDFLSSRLCFSPAGFDPMLNLISVSDLVEGLVLAAHSDAKGVFNLPGLDTLPLSELIRRWHCFEIPLPGFLLGPLYGARATLRGHRFRYDLNRWRFHFNAILDGKRARDVLGYEPHTSVFEEHDSE